MTSSRRKKNESSFADLSAKKVMRKKPLDLEHMVDIQPLTPAQEKVFESYAQDKNLFLYGAAGTGKTFVSLYLALKDVLNERTPYDKV